MIILVILLTKRTNDMINGKGLLMDKKIYDNYVRILHNELVPALGCTEPIAIAYAASKAAQVLGLFPEKIIMSCSGNIIKNVMGVTVPNSGGLKGIAEAAILGVVGGNPEKELEVLEGIKEQDIEKTKKLLGQNICECKLIEGVENLYIVARVEKDDKYAEVTIVNRHTLITKIEKNGEILFEHAMSEQSASYVDKKSLNVHDILAFTNEVDIDDIRKPIADQIELNGKISEEGLLNEYGAQVGRTLLKEYGNDVKIRARAKAAAGSDARMSGCSLPVVINSGSGNQGMTVSLPVIEYAKELGVSDDKMYRALVLANLLSLHQKKYIGSLSAYCGAVSAGCGAGAAITYLHGGDEAAIARTIINTIGNVGGIICDGAKPSCAAKIASSVEAGILGFYMSQNGDAFKSGEGIITDDIEETIKNIGYVGRIGMKQTDIEILNVMIKKANINE